MLGPMVRFLPPVPRAVERRHALKTLANAPPLEAMKMEFAVTAPADGEVVDIVCKQGRPIHAGQRLLVMQH